MSAKSRSYPPTLGPRNRYGAYSIVYRATRNWHTQKKPYIAPLPYDFSMATLTQLLNTNENTYDANSLIGPDSFFGIQREAQQTYNKAYTNFVSKLKSDSSELLTMYAERRKTLDGIAGRAVKLYQGFVAAKRGDVRTLKRLWGKGAGVRHNARKAGSHVLEYSFGYAPLIGDIASSVAVLANGVPPSKVRGKAVVPHTITIPFQGDYTGVRQWKFTLSYSIGADVRITNPNLALANQLGLLNPAATAWELVPWSFVIDYFVNVSDFLSSFTDFAGFELTNTYVTYHRQLQYLEVQRTSYPSDFLYGFQGTGIHVNRSLSIRRPTLLARPPWKLSPQRALTSVALLLQQLK